MGLSQHQVILLLIVVVLALSLLPSCHAFGAGNIPAYSYLEGKAFRHGDLEDILTQLTKKVGGGLLGRGSKFGGLDVKRIYFGNWLRDYSQAMDTAALSKMPKQSVLNLVMVLGFLAHGYATGAFEVTFERLGVYLPTEHIDNPKGYPNDAQKYDNRLRGPVDPRELEVDPRTGMKNYIANENGNWDTSSGLIRRTLQQCIQVGRQARQSGDEKTLHEAYRLLGQSLHTLEDLMAHSNWCELALYRNGHRNVFLHVGDNVKVRAPDGSSIAPLVTGTFGGADFMHSMFGEMQDHLSEASVSDLNKAVDNARSSGSNPVGDFMKLLGNVPGGSTSGVSRDAEELSRGPPQNVDAMSPQEVYRNLFKILAFRDSVMLWVEETIEKIPGLSSLVEKISNSLAVFVFTLIEPYVRPIVKQAMTGLQMGSAEVINNENQFEVFDDPNASDPTHSMLSKDHFGLVLNELAGQVAVLIVRHCVRLVVKAWDDDHLDATKTADECLAPMFHPFWLDRNRCHPIQQEMMAFVQQWASQNPQQIAKLDKQHVRTHTNTRSGKAEAHGHGMSAYGGVEAQTQQGYGMGTGMAHNVQTYMGNKINTAMGGHGQMVQGMFREAPGGGYPGREVGPNRYEEGDDSQSSYDHNRMGSMPEGDQYSGGQGHHGSHQGSHQGSGGRHSSGGHHGNYDSQSGESRYSQNQEAPSYGGVSSYPHQEQQQYQYGAPSGPPAEYGAPPPEYGGGGGGYGGPPGPAQSGYGAPPGPPQGYGSNYGNNYGNQPPPPQGGYGGNNSGYYNQGGYQ